MSGPGLVETAAPRAPAQAARPLQPVSDPALWTAAEFDASGDRGFPPAGADPAEPERRRHLPQLWLATPGGRPVAPVCRDRYARLGPDDRPAGGIGGPGTRFKAPLEPGQTH